MMNDACAKCGYDLTGLRASGIQTCPECGARTDEWSIAIGRDRLVTGRWSWFLLSPILALPCLILMGIGHPIATLFLGIVLAYRAFELEEHVADQWHRSGMVRLAKSFLLSLVWTIASCMIIWTTVGIAISQFCR